MHLFNSKANLFEKQCYRVSLQRSMEHKISHFQQFCVLSLMEETMITRWLFCTTQSSIPGSLSNPSPQIPSE